MPLGAVALRKRIEVEDVQDLASIPIIEKISFGGIISITEPEDRKDYKGRLFWAETGELIYSKIRVKQGSLAVIPAEIKRVAVSAEYPVYTIRTGQAIPDYIELVLRTRSFLQLLVGLAHGGSTKTRIPPEDFERLDIPVPPLETQRAILARWQAAQVEANAAENRVRQVEAETDFRSYATLALEAPKQGHKSRAFVAYWRGFSRWSVSFNQAAETGNLTRGKYPVAALGSILDLVQYGTSEKANSHGEGVPVLRISNIKNRALDLTDLKYIPLPTPAKNSLLLQDGDILIIRTSGSRDLVGTCAVFHESTAFVFASYLIRLRVAGDKADADYLSWFINSAFGRQQVDAISRQIMQNNINSEELRSLQIPLPPLDIQRAIVERIQTGRAEIARLRVDAERVRRAARAAVEALILGKGMS